MSFLRSIAVLFLAVASVASGVSVERRTYGGSYEPEYHPQYDYPTCYEYFHYYHGWCPKPYWKWGKYYFYKPNYSNYKYCSLKKHYTAYKPCKKVCCKLYYKWAKPKPQPHYYRSVDDSLDQALPAIVAVPDTQIEATQSPGTEDAVTESAQE